jgi:crotonobetainyl-CoA:carnitine CoA-transferase CaiB-like acyl-CoA transferase
MLPKLFKQKGNKARHFCRPFDIGKIRNTRRKRQMAGSLEGIRVLDLTIWYFGPMCASVLGDWGAEVIHIEDITGDVTREAGRLRGVVPVGGINWPWEFTNRNKKSITIDLRQESGQELLHKLIEKADVFVTNFLEGALKRMNADYESLSRINPKLIYAQGSGYGERGPDKEKPGYDFSAYWARSGIMATLGEPESLPIPLLPAMGDSISALCLAGGISTALFVREKTGEGQKVSLSLLGTGLWMGSFPAHAILFGNEFTRVSRKTVLNPLSNYYQTGDKKWIQLVCPQSQRYWPGFCKAAAREDLEHDPRFNSHENRMKNNIILISIIDELMLTKGRDEWGKLFDENGVIWGTVLTYSEVVNDPQVLENEYIVEVPHPRYGSIKLIASPLQFSKTPAKIRFTAPECGQHNEEILFGLGYS